MNEFKIEVSHSDFKKYDIIEELSGKYIILKVWGPDNFWKNLLRKININIPVNSIKVKKYDK